MAVSQAAITTWWFQSLRKCNQSYLYCIILIELGTLLKHGIDL